jgi:UDP-glucose 4-epimerase
MRIAVTGASGFIGSWIVRSLLSKGHEVVAYLRSESDTWRLPKHKNLFFKKMEENAENIDLAEQEISCLIIAGWFGVEQDERESNKQFDNLILFRNLLRAAEIGKVSTVIGIGSQAEYGKPMESIDEASAVFPKSNYAKAKVQASEILSEFGKVTGARVTWVRIFSVFGPLMPPVGFVPDLVYSNSGVKRVELHNPNLIWSFLDVRDCSEAITQIVENAKISGIVNLTNTENATLLEYAKQISPRSYSNLELVNNAGSPHDVVMQTQPEKLLLFGWKPRFRFDESLSFFRTWADGEKVKDPYLRNEWLPSCQGQ